MMDYHEVINFVLDYVESNQYLLTNAYNAVGQAGLRRLLYLDFISCVGSLIEQGAHRQGVALDEDYKQFLCAFYAEAIAGTLLDYIMHPQERSRERWFTIWNVCCTARCPRRFNKTRAYGNRMRTHNLPARTSAPISPPIFSVSPFAMESPSPVPPRAEFTV